VTNVLALKQLPIELWLPQYPPQPGPVPIVHPIADAPEPIVILPAAPRCTLLHHRKYARIHVNPTNLQSSGVRLADPTAV
jgi:hypothetical protein